MNPSRPAGKLPAPAPAASRARSTPPTPGWRPLRNLERQGWRCIAGVDEAGRGPLAGVVVAAAVILPRGLRLPGLTDSKLLDATRREDFATRLRQHPGVNWAIAAASVEEIDSLNILCASWLAMRRALETLAAAVPTLDHAHIDGRPIRGLALPHTALVKGDQLCLSIAAASVLAKVERDRQLQELDALHPGYGFARHKGYGTPEHLAALQKLGPCPAHRRSFAPVRALLPKPESAEPESVTAPDLFDLAD